MSYTLVRADKSLFATYHTIYSDADIEMWYDFDKRLEDTKWTDDCFFIEIDGRKIGGAVIIDNSITHPFLIPPFCDRTAFWAYILKHHKRADIRGVLDKDAEVLPMFGYRATDAHQVMCRPADRIAYSSAESYACRIFEQSDIEEFAQVMKESYAGGICEELDGEQTLEKSIADIKYVLEVYGTPVMSKVVTDKASGKILGGVMAGKLNDYVEIGELCVLPQFRGKGIAKQLLCEAITCAVGNGRFVKLFVYVGNNAEYLCRQMGFISGPRFTNFVAR